MYIARLDGGKDERIKWARIGRVEFSKTGRHLYYAGRVLRGHGRPWYSDTETQESFWIHPVRRRFKYPSSVPAEIDEDVRVRVLDDHPRGAAPLPRTAHLPQRLIAACDLAIASAFRLVPGYIEVRGRTQMAVAPRHVNELSSDDAQSAFDEAAQHYLQMSGAEFLRRWDAGEFADDDPAVMPVAMLLPLVGR